MCRNGKSLAMKSVQVCSKSCSIIFFRQNRFKIEGTSLCSSKAMDGRPVCPPVYMRWRTVFQQVFNFFILFGHCLLQMGLGKRSKGYKNPRDPSVSINTWKCLDLLWRRRTEEASWGSQKTVMFWGVMGGKEVRAHDAERPQGS